MECHYEGNSESEQYSEAPHTFAEDKYSDDVEVGSSSLQGLTVQPTNLAGTATTAPGVNSQSGSGRVKMSGAAKRRLAWWISQGRTLEEAKVLCTEKLETFQEYRTWREYKLAKADEGSCQSTSRGLSCGPRADKRPQSTNIHIEERIRKAMKTGGEAPQTFAEEYSVDDEVGKPSFEDIAVQPTSLTGTAITTGSGRKKLSGAAKKKLARLKMQGKTHEENTLCAEKIGSFQDHYTLNDDRDEQARAEDDLQPANSDGMIQVGIKGPCGPLSTAQCKEIEAEILRLIVSAGEGRGPSFHRSYRRAGLYFVHCADEFSKEWLIQCTGQLKPWERASLTAIWDDELPRPRLADAWIPDARLGGEAILLRIKTQNRQIDFSHWQVVTTRQESNGQTVTFTFDESSCELLARQGNKLFFGMSCVHLNLKSPKEVNLTVREECPTEIAPVVPHRANVPNKEHSGASIQSSSAMDNPTEGLWTPHSYQALGQFDAFHEAGSDISRSRNASDYNSRKNIGR